MTVKFVNPHQWETPPDVYSNRHSVPPLSKTIFEDSLFSIILLLKDLGVYNIIMGHQWNYQVAF